MESENKHLLFNSSVAFYDRKNFQKLDEKPNNANFKPRRWLFSRRETGRKFTIRLYVFINYDLEAASIENSDIIQNKIFWNKTQSKFLASGRKIQTRNAQRTEIVSNLSTQRSNKEGISRINVQ